jgi:AraC-like DNA-binding protein
MEPRIDHLTIPILQNRTRSSDSNYLGEDLILVMDNHELGRTWFQIGQPYRPEENVFIRVKEGIAVYTVNLTRYELHPGDILVFPAFSIFSIDWVTPDQYIQFMSFRELTLSHPIMDCRRYTPREKDNLRIESYLQMIWRIVSEPSFSMPAVLNLQAALLEDLEHIGSSRDASGHPTRQEEVFDRFISLLNNDGGVERSIPYYADKLCLTPNRLSSIVKKVSGHTVMEWINRTAVIHAKLLLKHSPMMMYEIADRLHFPNPSFFSKFFKRETGMTPAEYRQS